MDFRKETRGENATKSVEQVALFYDKGVYTKDGQVKAHYARIFGHPESALGRGQTQLDLVTDRREKEDGTTSFSHDIALYPKQLEAIKQAAGDNTAPLLDKGGNRVGTIYGYRSDLITADHGGKTVGFMPNTKTLAPSELSVADKDGASIQERIFAAMRDAKEQAAQAKEQAAPVQAEPQVEAEAQVEAPEDELSLA